MLHLAASTGERAVEQALIRRCSSGARRFDYATGQGELAQPAEPSGPPELHHRRARPQAAYDALLLAAGGECVSAGAQVHAPEMGHAAGYGAAVGVEAADGGRRARPRRARLAPAGTTRRYFLVVSEVLELEAAGRKERRVERLRRASQAAAPARPSRRWTPGAGATDGAAT